MPDLSEQDSAIYCRECEYNLTGLPLNRCPECGTPFDPNERRVASRLLPQPITFGEMCYKALSPCAIGLAVHIPPLAAMLFIFPGVLIFLIATMINAHTLAERWVRTRAINRGELRTWRRPFLIGVGFVFLWAVQVFGAFVVGVASKYVESLVFPNSSKAFR